jgi:glycerol uptake facilitator-like aquaporin
VPFRVNGAGWWAVYLVAPLLGGLLGGGIYTACFKPACRAEE